MMSTPHEHFKVGGLNRGQMGLSSNMKLGRSKSPLDTHDYTQMMQGSIHVDFNA